MLELCGRMFKLEFLPVSVFNQITRLAAENALQLFAQKALMLLHRQIRP